MGVDKLVTRMGCAMLEGIPPLGAYIPQHVALVRTVLDSDAEPEEELAAPRLRYFDHMVRTVLSD